MALDIVKITPEEKLNIEKKYQLFGYKFIIQIDTVRTILKYDNKIIAVMVVNKFTSVVHVLVDGEYVDRFYKLLECVNK